MIEGLIILFELFSLFLLLIKIKKNKDTDLICDLGIFSYKDSIIKN